MKSFKRYQISTTVKQALNQLPNMLQTYHYYVPASDAKITAVMAGLRSILSAPPKLQQLRTPALQLAVASITFSEV
jgi:hypothetical protein